MNPSVIVWDVETVPDLARLAAANDLVGKSDSEVCEAIGDKFPRHIYHSIVCIGARIAHREPDRWAVVCDNLKDSLIHSRQGILQIQIGREPL